MEFHDAANIFPLDEENIDDLAEDIRKNGQQVPVEVFEGQIIDGRRRWKACEKVGVAAKIKNVSPADPVCYVLSLNLHRRHLSPTQLAMVGAKARSIYDRQAKERQQEHGHTAPGKKSLVETLPQVNTGKARDQAGKAVGVSGKLIDAATKVLASGTPSLIAAVDADHVAVSTAARISTFPDQEQDSLARRAKESAKMGHSRRQSKSETRQEQDDDMVVESKPEGVLQGVGVYRANEAINSLMRIPKNDALRKRGFQIVTDWIRANS